MPVERYFNEMDSFIEGEGVQIKGAEFHHFAHVVRTRKGEFIELINGRGSLAQAVVKEVKKDRAEVAIVQVFQEKERLPRLILAQAFPRANRLDFILEKGTELGCDSFWLFPGNQSAKTDFYPSRLERVKTVTIAALKQCGRLFLPSILMKPPIENWKTNIGCTLYFGDLSEGAPLLGEILKKNTSPLFPIVFITGPESGFSAEEIQILRHLGAQGVKLHQNILRTDTASLMALSLLGHWQMLYAGV